MHFTWEEIAKATKGTIVKGDGQTVFSSFAQDSRVAKDGDVFFPIVGENRDGHDFLPDVASRGGRAFLFSREDAPGLIEDALGPEERDKLHLIRVGNTEEALRDLAHYGLEKTGCKVVGVTGSTGKTSTKDMTACVMGSRYKVGSTKGNLNTLIGLSLCILEFDEDTEVAVLEMGMDRAGEIRQLCSLAPPTVGLITNIGISHLENLGSREAIFHAKMEIASRMGKGDRLIITMGEDYLRPEHIEGDFELFTTGREEGCHMQIKNLRERGVRGLSFDLLYSGNTIPVDLPVPGAHNAGNATLAIAAGLALGIPPEEGARALRQLNLTGGRLKTKESKGLILVDDTYNASPDSMRAALDVLAGTEGGSRFAVLGDMLELGAGEAEYHRSIGEYARDKGIEHVMTTGTLAAHTAEGAGAIGEHYPEKSALVEALLKKAKEGDILLFKGSRGMHMEEVLKEVEEKFERK